MKTEAVKSLSGVVQGSTDELYQTLAEILTLIAGITGIKVLEAHFTISSMSIFNAQPQIIYMPLQIIRGAKHN